MLHTLKTIGFALLRIYIIVCLAITVIQRTMLYFPTHQESGKLAKYYGLKEWVLNGETIGYSRAVATPKRVWLLLHGNGGQAIDRIYALPSFGKDDGVFILEYPGYGGRKGSPSKDSFNAAAKEAYFFLRKTYPNLEVSIFGESLGSGPSCYLATLPTPPDRFVLVVPFDRLVDVAREKMPFLPIGLMMFDRWDNIEALSAYRGRIDIYGATGDVVIPMRHAKNLADAVSGSHFHEMKCGHNEWADTNDIDLAK